MTRGCETVSRSYYISRSVCLLVSFTTALRVEWAKAKARAARWAEQVRLVDEEMRRVISATQYIAKEWNLRRSQRQSQAGTMDSDLDEGLAAYADEHCDLETARAAAFEAKWRAVRIHASNLINGAPPPSGTTAPPAHDSSAILEIAVEVPSSDEEDYVDEGGL